MVILLKYWHQVKNGRKMSNVNCMFLLFSVEVCIKDTITFTSNN